MIGRFLIAVTLIFGLTSSQVRGIDMPAIDDLDAIGVLNASHYPGIVADGITDVSDALNAAILEAYTSQKVLLLESGTYLVSKQILCKQQYDNKKLFAHQIIGSTAGDRPVIKLKSGSPDFQDVSSPLAVIRFMCEDDPKRPTGRGEKPSINFNQGIRNIDIEVDINNPGANGIDFAGAQQCFIEDTKITMKSGFAGIYDAPGCSVLLGNIEVIEGQYGIYSTTDPTACFQNITLLDQKVAAIYNEKWVFPTAFSGLYIKKDKAPAIVMADGAHSQSWAKSSITIVDGIIEFDQESSEPAIDNRYGQALTLHNVYFINSGTIVKGAKEGDHLHTSTPSYWSNVKEYGGVVDEARGLNFIDGVICEESMSSIEEGVEAPNFSLVTAHGWDINLFPSPDVVLAKIEAGDSNYAIASASFDPDHPVIPGTNVGDKVLSGNDVTANLQWLIDNYQTVLIPRGRYLISNTLQLHSNTRILGVGNHISQIAAIDTWRPNSVEYMMETPNDADASISLFNIKLLVSATCTEDVAGNWFGYLDWQAGRNSVVKNTHCQSFNSTLTTCANNYSRVWIHNNGGGTWYNCDPIGNPKGSYGNEYLDLLIEGTTEPLVFYNLNIEDASGDYVDKYQMEIRNSSNISVFGFKSENTDDILINETDTGDGIQTKNICFFGVGGVCEIRVINARDILMSNVLARNYTHPVSYIQYGIKEIYGSTTTTIEQIEPIAIYKRGNPFWYTRLGPVKDTLIQNAETEYTSVRIYPNPSTGEFIIDHPMEYLEVFNISGKRILQ